MLQITERILLTLWIGGMWVIGFVVAPTLFTMLDDRSVAGSVAGRLFTIISYIGLASSLALISALFFDLGGRALKAWRAWLLCGMLLIILFGQFVLQPEMAALKQAGLHGDAAARFGRLHGISSALFGINSLAGLVLVIFGVIGREQDYSSSNSR